MSSGNMSEMIWGASLSLASSDHVSSSSPFVSPNDTFQKLTASENSGFETSFGAVNLYNSQLTSISFDRTFEKSVSFPSGSTSRLPGISIVEPSARGGTSNAHSTRSEILERCRKRYVQIAAAEEIEYGSIAPSEVLLNEYFERYGSLIGDIVQHMYLAEIGKNSVLISLLKALSSRSYKSVYPYAQTVAIAALSSRNLEVREAGIRAFENWEHLEGIGVLKSLVVSPSWLDEYRLDTIEYLESLL